MISTSETSYFLIGDKLEEIVIADNWTGGTYQWALGDGWEIWFGDYSFWGRGKNKHSCVHG